MTTINLNTIRGIVQRTFEDLDAKGISSIEIDDDYYWNIPTDQMSKILSDPELTVGSIKDDVEYLERLYKENYTSNFLELDRLAAIFRTMGLELRK